LVVATSLGHGSVHLVIADIRIIYLKDILDQWTVDNEIQLSYFDLVIADA